MLERFHHAAYVVKDQAATRRFYEDVLGLPLLATWAEVGPFKAFPGRQIEYCHTFFGLGDGSALAFFAFADEDVYETLRNRNGLAHLAIAVTSDEQIRLRDRLEEAGWQPRFIDHGYVQSLYVDDPDQLVVEFTAEPEDAASISSWQRATARQTLSRWLTGDRSPNNRLR